MYRLALYGPRGAGKTTVSRTISEMMGAKVVIIHSASPLYDLQAVIYMAAGLPNPPGGMQDGHLLKILAAEVRRLNPDALAEKVVLKAEEYDPLYEPSDARSDRDPHLLLCDDSTPADRAYLDRHAFRFAFITAEASIRAGRRERRGDVRSILDGNDPTVHRIGEDDFVIINDGSITVLQQQVERLIHWVRS